MFFKKKRCGASSGQPKQKILFLNKSIFEELALAVKGDAGAFRLLHQ